MNKFSMWLLDEMCKFDISQEELALHINSTQTQISRHVTGKRKPRYKTVKKYCDFFGEKDVFKIYELSLE